MTKTFPNDIQNVDVVVLGATEVDINFNANVITHSDGKMLHGIGGWQNCLFSKCTILPIPASKLSDSLSIIIQKSSPNTLEPLQ